MENNKEKKLEKKTNYKEYKGTASYRRFMTSLTCTITVGAAYGAVEAMWGGLGYFLGVSVLLYMALYANIPLSIFVGSLVVLAIVNFRKFKKKVDDGSIKDEPSFSGYISTGYISTLPASTTIGSISDATLSPTEKKVKGLIQMYPKITMAGLAAKTGVPEGEIEGILLKLVSNGNIRGHVDPGTGEFISGMIDTTRVTPVDDAVFDCPYCGAVMKSAPVKGTSIRCESCKNLIVVK